MLLPGGGGQPVNQLADADTSPATVDLDPPVTADGLNVADAAALQIGEQARIGAVYLVAVTPAGTPASSAAAIVCRAKVGFVANAASVGTPALEHKPSR